MSAEDREEPGSRRELEQALRPVLARVRLAHVLAWGWRALLAALALAGLVLGLARAFPWAGAGLWALTASGLALAAAALGTWLTLPDLFEAARAADRLGLAERAVTALELGRRGDKPAGHEGELVRRQRQDALSHLGRLDPAQVGLPLGRPLWTPVALTLAAVVLLVATPNPMAAVAAQQGRERTEARRQAEAVGRLADQVEAQLAKQGSDADPRLKETLDALKRLQQELRRVRNGQEAERALARAREQLQRQADPSSLASARGLDQLGKALSSAALTEPAGKKLEQGLSREAAEALREAAKAVQSGASNLTDAERQQLAARLQQAANAARGGQGLASSLRQLAQALAAGQQAGSNVGQGGASAGNAGQNGSTGGSTAGSGSLSGAQAQAVAQGLQNLAGAVQAAGSSISGQATLASLLQQLGQLQGQMLAAASGQGQGSGSGSGSGQGGAGQHGSGQGSGSGGSSAGSGSSNGDGGQGGQAPLGNSGPLGQTNRPGETGSYERIYAPQLLGGDSQGSLIGGSPGGPGQEDVVDADETPAVAGDLVPYDRVWADYEDLIRDSLERSDLPPSMAEVLRRYFSSLEPGQ